MSECDCGDCGEEEQSDEQEQKYEAFIQAGNLAVQVEGESSDDAQERVEDMFEQAVEQVKRLNGDERRSVGLK